MSDLGKAYIQIVPSAQGISGSISQVISGEATSAGQKAGLNIAGGIGTALKSATGVLAAGTAAVSTALVKGANDVAQYGDNIDKMSQKMGLSRQSYQEWDAVMQHSGTSMEAMKSSMKTLANAAQTNSSAFEKLGISQKDLASMSQEQLFEATISALQNVESETERTYLAGKTLGKGATELGALLNTSAEDTQAMRDRVHELGGVMSDEAVLASAQFQDNMQDLQTAISGVGRGIITQLLPSFNDILAGFTSLIIGEEGATEKISSGFESLFSNLDSIASNIVNTITEMMPGIIEGITTILPQIIEMAATLIISFSQALVTQMPTILTTVLPALAEAAVNIVIALGVALVQAAPALFDAGVQLFDMFKNSFNGGDMLSKGVEMVQGVLDGITERLPGMLEGGVEMLTSLANGILQNIPQLITTAGQLITQFTSFIMQNYPTILQAGANLLLNLVNGIVNNLPQIVNSVVQVIASFVATVVANLPTILAQGITIIVKLAAGLIQAIPTIVAAIPQIIQAIVNTFGSYDWPTIGINIIKAVAQGLTNAVNYVLSAIADVGRQMIESFTSIDWKSIGLNIIQGIANGITDALDIIKDAAKGAAESAFNAAKEFLGIESPAKKGIYLGEMLGAGFAIGIEDSQKMVGDAINDLSESATANLMTSGSYELSSSTSTDDKMDVLLQMLGAYLPQIAEKEGIDVQKLYNGFNRQLGWAMT